MGPECKCLCTGHRYGLDYAIVCLRLHDETLGQPADSLSVQGVYASAGGAKQARKQTPRIHRDVVGRCVTCVQIIR